MKKILFLMLILFCPALNAEELPCPGVYILHNNGRRCRIVKWNQQTFQASEEQSVVKIDHFLKQLRNSKRTARIKENDDFDKAIKKVKGNLSIQEKGKLSWDLTSELGHQLRKCIEERNYTELKDIIAKACRIPSLNFPLFISPILEKQDVKAFKILTSEFPEEFQKLVEKPAFYLYCISYSGCKFAFEHFLSIGGDIKIPIDKDNLSALHLAASRGFTDLLEFLIENNLDVNQKTTQHCFTPIYLALQHGKTETAKILLEHGADPEIADSKGNLPSSFSLFKALK